MFARPFSGLLCSLERDPPPVLRFVSGGTPLFRRPPAEIIHAAFCPHPVPKMHLSRA